MNRFKKVYFKFLLEIKKLLKTFFSVIMPEIDPNLHSRSRRMRLFWAQINNSYPNNWFANVFMLSQPQQNWSLENLIHSFISAINTKVKIPKFWVFPILPLRLNVSFKKINGVNFALLIAKFVLFMWSIIRVDEEILSFGGPFPK